MSCPGSLGVVHYTDHQGSIDAQGGGYPPGGYGPPGGGGGYGPPGGPPPGGYGPPGSPPGGYGPPGSPPGGYGPPGSPPGGYGPPGSPPGGYGPPGSPPGGYGPPGSPPGGYGPPGGGPPGYGPPGGGYGPPGGGGFMPPYQPPGAPPPPPGAGSGLEATEAISFGWNAVTKDFAGVALPLAVAGFVSTLPSGVISGIRGGIVGALTASGSVDSTALMLINGGGSLISYLISIIVQAYMLGGIVHFALRVARGEKPEFGVVFSGGRFFAPMLGATLLYTLGITVGFMACLVPGLFLFAGWIAYSAFVVDKGLGGVEALKASWQATTPYRT